MKVIGHFKQSIPHPFRERTYFSQTRSRLVGHVKIPDTSGTYFSQTIETV